MTLHRFRAFWVVVSLLLSRPLSGASPAPSALDSRQTQTPLVFAADVTLVTVPVFVTDRSGKSVPGLTAEDFEVYESGRRVPIAAFQAVDVQVASPATAPVLPMAVQAASARQYLLLFDLEFSLPAGVLRARKAATRFVRESLGPGDLVAVATYGRRGFKMLTNLTTDHDYVARAIDGLGLVPSLKLADDPLALSGEFEAPAGASQGGRSALADEAIGSEIASLKTGLTMGYNQRVLDFLGTLEDLAKALSPLRGRKQVVLLSAGFGQSLWTSGEAMEPIAMEPMTMRPDPGGEAAIRDQMYRLFRAAGESDVAIDTVNLAGLENPVDVSSRDGRNRSYRTGYNTLAALAANTGGRFILPTNDFGLALREVEQVSRQFYVLAFEPAGPAVKHGRPRSLKVRVRGDGLTVSHRTAYVLVPSSSPSDPAALRLVAAEAVAKGLSGGSLGLHVVALPYRDRDGATNVHAILHVDGPGLATAARNGRLDVQVYGYAVAQGRVLDSLAFNISVDLSKRGASLRSEGLRVLTSFVVPPGTVDLRFFVRAGSGKTGSIQRHVQVPGFIDGQLALSAPMLALPLEGRIAFPADTRRGRGLALPFRLGGRYFVPDAVSLQPGRARDLCVFAWRPAGFSAPLEVAGELARSGEAPLALRIEGAPQVVRDDDGFDRYVVTVVPPEAPLGDYTLRLSFREPVTGGSARSETAVLLQN
jgi:VWFA-related protein